MPSIVAVQPNSDHSGSEDATVPDAPDTSFPQPRQSFVQFDIAVVRLMSPAISVLHLADFRKGYARLHSMCFPNSETFDVDIFTYRTLIQTLTQPQVVLLEMAYLRTDEGGEPRHINCAKAF